MFGSDRQSCALAYNIMRLVGQEVGSALPERRGVGKKRKNVPQSRLWPHFQLDAFVVMPNHVHGIVVLVEDSVGAGLKPAPATTRKRHGLPEIVRAFKTFSARRINQVCNALGTPVWQRNYYEHVIRDLSALKRVQEYIHTNPLRWDMDRENPYRKREDVFDLWLKSFHGRPTEKRL